MSLGRSKVDEVLSAAIAGRNGARYQLIAEQLPHTDGWDWAVWRLGDAPAAARHGDAPAAARHGDAPSVQAAIQAAEAAVQHWDDTAASSSFARFLIHGRERRLAQLAARCQLDEARERFRDRKRDA